MSVVVHRIAGYDIVGTQGVLEPDALQGVLSGIVAGDNVVHRIPDIQAEVGGATSKIARAFGAHRIRSQAQGRVNVVELFKPDDPMTFDILADFVRLGTEDPAAINRFITSAVICK